MPLWRAEVKRKSVFALVSDVPKQAFSMFFSETMHGKQDLLARPVAKPARPLFTQMQIFQCL